SGIDQFEIPIPMVHQVVNTVTRHTGSRIHHRDKLSRLPVQNRAFTDVRSTDDCNFGYRHEEDQECIQQAMNASDVDVTAGVSEWSRLASSAPHERVQAPLVTNKATGAPNPFSTVTHRS